MKESQFKEFGMTKPQLDHANIVGLEHHQRQYSTNLKIRGTGISNNHCTWLIIFSI
jgi:hypothetical protein